MTRLPVTVRIAYLIVGIALFPAVFSLTYVVFRLAFTSQDFVPNVAMFFIGFTSHFIFFLAFRKPMLAYVIGHELTHAMWVIIFRGRVKSIKVTSRGGQVRATKANPLIILAPYFFPLYTLAVIAIWQLVRWFYPPFQSLFPVAIFLIGFTWSFHLLLNLYMLRESQQDIRAVGHVFSAVFIYALNVFILGLLVTYISSSLTYSVLFQKLKANILFPYNYVGDWISDTIELTRNATPR